ncbi:YveK family protein [Ligilactobacillus equi]|uniref:Capsular polysaccharide biosynthesis protein CpsC n=1 Tax=Ligilactobacillus equi DSM 15833 = JCM 10991 TaxID=1423740 RepID=A0A0R1TYC0_9LACO|nr:Wzz/FepE/Etk N-terminal domain-containing protein [Ligilactobacillus equi]KRL85236.1 lipopolysaccharide chain length determining protein [Ligilactobacillus equi DSM 15833 = JCM 10991]
MKDNTSQETVIDLSQIIKALKDDLAKIIAWAVAGLLVAIVVVTFFITPKYSATIDLLVNQKADNTATQYTAQQADLQAINTYQDVLKKSVILTPVLKQVRKTDNYKGNLGSLQSSVTVSNTTNSQVVSVTVEDTNAYTAADIANTIGDVFTEKIKKMMKVDNVTIVTKAKANTNATFPNKKLFAAVGLVIGALIGMAIAVIKELTNTTVKDSDFLTDDLELVNLGTVYHMDSERNLFNVSSIKGSEYTSSNRRV